MIKNYITVSTNDHGITSDKKKNMLLLLKEMCTNMILSAGARYDINIMSDSNRSTDTCSVLIHDNIIDIDKYLELNTELDIILNIVKDTLNNLFALGCTISISQFKYDDELEEGVFYFSTLHPDGNDISTGGYSVKHNNNINRKQFFLQCILNIPNLAKSIHDEFSKFMCNLKESEINNKSGLNEDQIKDMSDKMDELLNKLAKIDGKLDNIENILK